MIDNDTQNAYNGDNQLTTFNKNDASSNARSYYLYNQHGDVTTLIDKDGITLKSYDYDEFGNEINPSSTDKNPFRYSGEYYDLSSGNYYLRARYYNPEIGRFISEDSYRGEDNDPLSLNLYTYCANDAVNQVDPTGHDAIWLEDSTNVDFIIKKCGHTGLLIEKGNQWYHFYYGATGNGSSGKIGSSAQVRALKKGFKFTTLAKLNNELKESYKKKVKTKLISKGKITGNVETTVEVEDPIYSRGYDGYLYFKGNFDKSYSFMKNYKKTYNLILNNCMQVSTDVLSKGTFRSHDPDFKTASFTNEGFDDDCKHALKLARSMVVPNDAFKGMKFFHEQIIEWKRANWLGRMFMKSPYDKLK